MKCFGSPDLKALQGDHCYSFPSRPLGTASKRVVPRNTSEFDRRRICLIYSEKRQDLNRETEMLRQWRYSHPSAWSQSGNLILLCKFKDTKSESFWYKKGRPLMYPNIRYFWYIRQTDKDIGTFLKTWGHCLGSPLEFPWRKPKLKDSNLEKRKQNKIIFFSLQLFQNINDFFQDFINMEQYFCRKKIVNLFFYSVS